MSSRENPAVGFNHLSRGGVVFAHGPKESAFRSAADIELSADVSSTGRSCDRRSVANRASLWLHIAFNPFVGFFDFSDHAELVQLIKALLGIPLGQILTSADTDIITLSIGFYVFRAGELAHVQTL